MIELMITIAIVGILSAIAYPAYRESVSRGKRAEAQAILLEASQYMERFYAENYRYDQNTAGVGLNDPAIFLARYTQSPRPPAAANYTITVPSATLTQNSYIVKATRTGNMATDKCGNFGITNLGKKVIDSYSSAYASDADALAACWK